MSPRWLKLSSAVSYSAIGKKRLVRMCVNGELKAYQDQHNKMAWIIDRLSIDEYHENNMPSDLIKENVIEFLGRV